MFLQRRCCVHRHSMIFIGLFSSIQLLAVPAPTITQLDSFGQNPRVRAFLDMIAFAEGTLGKDEYYAQYGQPPATSLKSHPGSRVCLDIRGKTVCSTAAGRYMFLERIWASTAKKLGLRDFMPKNQDRAALYLLYMHGVIPIIQNGQIAQAIDRVKRTWSTMPNSPYGQPTQRLDALLAIFKKKLASYTGRWN